MREHVFLILFCAGVISAAQSNPATSASVALPEFENKPKYCLFFTVDGLDRDYITTSTAPNIYSWMKAGVEMPDAINVYPTLTTPNMTSLVTGAFPRTTGIGSNQVFLKDENKVVRAPRFNAAVTIGEVFQETGHATAAVQQFMLQNRGADQYIHTGSKVAEDITTTALTFLSETDRVPTLMVVLYQSVDAEGHLHGQDSMEVREEVTRVDAEMAKVVQRYSELEILKDTLVVVSSDHGMSSTEKDVDRKELNQAITGGGWKYDMLNPMRNPADDVDLHVMSYANLQCYFNREFSPGEQERLFAAIKSVEGVGRIYDSTALRRMGAHPNAGDFIVEPAAGWWFGAGGGTHGRNRESDGHQSMMGAGIKPHSKAEGVRTVDLVPTVLKAFDLPIPHTVDGKPLVDVLQGQ